MADWGNNNDTAATDGWGATENGNENGNGDAGSQHEAEPQEVKPVPETDLKSSLDILGGLNPNEKQQWGEKTAFNYESFQTGPATEEIIQGSEWASSGVRYEWKDEYGELAPKDEELEKILFGEENHVCSGIEFNKLLTIPIKIEGDWQPNYINKFADANLHPVMLDNIKLCQYKVPTPIQRACIPIILEGYDLLSCAQTGSGKTAAFLIPILSKLYGKAKKLAAPRPRAGNNRGYRAEPLVMIVAPTRELATQIFNEARKFCYRSMLRPCVVYGGADSRAQRAELEKGCDIIIGTPGRLQDFIERGNIRLNRIKFTVIDEADEMLDMGFDPQLRKLLHSGDHNEDDDLQVLMFSATFPKQVRKLARDFLADNYIRVNVGRIGSVNPNVIQRIVYTDFHRKRDALYDLIQAAPAARTLIFVNSKREADNLDDFLYNRGLPTTSIHGDRNQREREDALMAFRCGKCPLLIATGVASRGLDIANVMHVINYDMVKGIDEYIHRIGRTGRIGNHGLATTFYNEGDSEIAGDLVKVLMECGQEIPGFLEEYKPEGELVFDDASEDEDEGGAAEGGDGGAWGGGGGDDAAAAGGGWGGGAAAATDTGGW